MEGQRERESMLREVRRGSNTQALDVYFKGIYFLLRATEGFKLGSNLIQFTF